MRQALLVGLACLVFTVASAGSAVAAPGISPRTSQAGAADLAAMSAAMRAAHCVRFDAVVHSVEASGGAAESIRVSGLTEYPKRFALSISGSSDPSSEIDAYSDGTTSVAVSQAKKLYFRDSATDDGFQPETPETVAFMNAEANEDAVTAESAADFFFSLEGLSTNGGASVSLRHVRRNGAPCDDVRFVTIMQDQPAIVELTIDRATHLPGSVMVSAVQNGATIPVFSVQMRALQVVASTTAISAFQYSPAPGFQLYVPPAAPGTIAPNFTVENADGSKVKLSDFAGKIVVLDFWAVWCQPCELTLPLTDKLAAQYKNKGVVFLPICSWDTLSDFRSWKKARPAWTMHFVFDPAGEDQADSIAQKSYGVYQIPTQYVIGRNGRVVYCGYCDPNNETPLIDAIDRAGEVMVATGGGRVPSSEHAADYTRPMRILCAILLALCLAWGFTELRRWRVAEYRELLTRDQRTRRVVNFAALCLVIAMAFAGTYMPTHDVTKRIVLIEGIYWSACLAVLAVVPIIAVIEYCAVMRRGDIKGLAKERDEAFRNLVEMVADSEKAKRKPDTPRRNGRG
jgi:thiol-disulfide isomerase/thioredoxin